MAATFVPITREEFEDWLQNLVNQSPFAHKWSQKPGTKGVYRAHLSDNVCVEISATIGRMDEVMGVGNASMQLRLVSIPFGHVLNKKAQGQVRFNRTTGWKVNWADGANRFAQVYLQGQSFYEALAEIEDRQEYEKTMLAAIQGVAGWEQNHFLKDMHDRVSQGNILTIKQKEAVLRAAGRAPAQTQEPHPLGLDIDEELEKKLNRLRALWTAAKDKGDDWTMNFVNSIGQHVKAKRPLSDRQVDILEDKLDRYRLASTPSPQTDQLRDLHPGEDPQGNRASFLASVFSSEAQVVAQKYLAQQTKVLESVRKPRSDMAQVVAQEYLAGLIPVQ